MHDPNLPEIAPARNPKSPSPVVDFAKWPPDDGGPGMPAGGGGVPAGGGYDSGDGNFKRGRTAPVAILIGVLAVGGLGAFLALGAKHDAAKLSVEQGEQEKKNIFVLPKNEQTPKWREWAMGEKAAASDEVRMEALKQLAWAKDPEGG